MRDVRRDLLRMAGVEACRLGSRTIEAEHLLLALAQRGGGPAGALLDAVGLDRDAVEAALEREVERSLAAVGVDLDEHAIVGPVTPPRRQPQLAASAKRALERAARFARAHRARRIGDGHLLVGILQAELGTVPRALAAAGVDPIALRARAEDALA